MLITMKTTSPYRKKCYAEDVLEAKTKNIFAV